jgi:hypothetical protein
MPPQPETHPPREQLLAFLGGNLPEAEAVVLEEHLSSCPACVAALDQPPEDTLVRLARDAHRDGAAATRATELGPAAPGLTTPPASAGPEAVPLDDAPAGMADHPRYRLLRLLGQGGMGAVYQAEHRLMGRLVALKIIRREFTARPGAAERFRREVRSAARLQHPNIVTAHDADQAGDTHFLVMEYVEGRTLGQLLREDGPLPVADACACARQAALGLQHAHEKGMVHRDIKPENLMRTADGTVKILDFGLAMLGDEPAAEGSRLTDENVVMGTPDYMAPEQAEDPRGADVRADVYSLGCTLYHLLTGRVPFPRQTAMLKLVAHRDERPEPLRARRPGVPPALAAVVKRMMARQPHDRYPTPAAVAEALAPFAAGPAAARRPPRRRRLAALALLLAGTVLAGATVLRLRNSRGDDIVVRTDDPAIELVTRKGDALVAIRDTKSGESWWLDADRYTLGQADRPGGLTIDLPGERPFVLRRHEQGVVTVTRERAAAPPLPFAERSRRLAPADALRREDIPPAALARAGGGDPGQAPRELVAVLGDGRLRRLSQGAFPAFNPAGTVLAVPSGNDVMLFDAVTGQYRRTLTGHTGEVYCFAFSPDGRLLASAAWDHTVRLWDLASGQTRHVLAGHRDQVYGVAFAPDGTALASTGPDGTVRLWKVATGAAERCLETGESMAAVAFSPDGKQVAASAFGGAVRVWDAADGAPRWTRPHGPTRLRGIAFSPDGKLLASGSHTQLRLWDAHTGDEVRTVETPADGLLAFSPDGGRLWTMRHDYMTAASTPFAAGRPPRGRRWTSLRCPFGASGPATASVRTAGCWPARTTPTG